MNSKTVIIKIILPILILAVFTAYIVYDTSRSREADQTVYFQPAGEKITEAEDKQIIHSGKYVLNIQSKKIHTSDCAHAQRISEENRQYSDDIDEAASEGYTLCSTCLSSGE